MDNCVLIQTHPNKFFIHLYDKDNCNDLLCMVNDFEIPTLNVYHHVSELY